MTDMQYIEIFPTAVGSATIDRGLTVAEKDFINSYKSDVKEMSGGNFISNDWRVLDHEPLQNLRSDLELRVNEYFNKVYDPKDEVYVYITAAWVTWTGMNQGHHPHNHPNSFLSGTFYIDSGPNDMISYIKPDVLGDDIFIYSETNNIFTTKSWHMLTPKNNLKIFSSRLKHEVLLKPDDVPRCCLAFNTWFRGKVGADAEIYAPIERLSIDAWKT